MPGTVDSETTSSTDVWADVIFQVCNGAVLTCGMRLREVCKGLVLRCGMGLGEVCNGAVLTVVCGTQVCNGHFEEEHVPAEFEGLLKTGHVSVLA